MKFRPGSKTDEKMILLKLSDNDIMVTKNDHKSYILGLRKILIYLEGSSRAYILHLQKASTEFLTF